MVLLCTAKHHVNINQGKRYSMKARTVLSVLLVALMAFSLITGCAEQPASGTTATEEKKEFWATLDPNTSGEITIAMKDGDGVYYEDIGSKEINEWDLTGKSTAYLYGMAKAWKKMYPNVKINVFTIAGDYNSTGVSWQEVIGNFKLQYGKYPDIWLTNDLPGDVNKGLAADISGYADDPLYRSLNKTMMDQLNYYGVQAGLPQYVAASGIWVNKTLAEQHNIDVPDIDWDLDDYTEFIGKADATTFWGSMDSPMGFLDSATKDVDYMFTHRDGTGAYIDITTEAVKDILSYVPQWSKTTIWPQYEIGNVPGEVMDQGWWDAYHTFQQSLILTLTGSPWMMGYSISATPNDNTLSFEFDIYPHPSTDYVDNTVGLIIDPIAIHNYALDDGDAALSESEKASLDLSYAFASWWVGTTEAMQARANQQYCAWGWLYSALDDSIPCSTGAKFDEQMELWYSADAYAPYKNFEGWQRCIEIVKDGQFWNVNNKTMPVKFQQDGQTNGCYWEWQNIYSTITARRASDQFIDEIKSKLVEWNETFNDRFELADQALKKSLKDYYGLTDADFQ